MTYAVSLSAALESTTSPGRVEHADADGETRRITEQTRLPLFSPVVFPALRSPAGRKLLTEFLDARLTVERAVAELAAARRTHEDQPALDTVAWSLDIIVRANARGREDAAARAFAVVETLHLALGRAARNRFLAAESRISLDRLRDGAAWLAPLLATRCAVSQYSSLADAVRSGDGKQAADTAGMLADLVESWIWRRLSAP